MSESVENYERLIKVGKHVNQRLMFAAPDLPTMYYVLWNPFNDDIIFFVSGMSTIEFHNVDNDQRFPIHSKSIVLCNVTGEGLNISWIFKGRVLVRGK